MVNTKNEHKRQWKLAVFSAIIAIFYSFFYNYHLLFVEQLHLFEWNSTYFYAMTHNPGGFARYIGEFFTQFFFLNHLGGIILALCIWALLSLYESLLFKWEINALGSTVPGLFLALFYLNTNASLGLILGLIIALLCVLATIREKREQYRFIFSLLSLPICYLLTGIGSFLYVGLLYLNDILYEKKYPLYKWICLAIITILMPLVSYYQYDLTETQAWIGTACLISNDSSAMLYAVLGSFFLTPFLIYYFSKTALAKHKKIITGINLLVFLPLLLFQQKKVEEEELYQIHYLTTHEHWEQAIKLAENTHTPNVLLSSYANIALLNKQMLSKKLFTLYQTPHINEFWSSNHLLNYITAETYFQMNMPYAARAYMFMANTQTPLGISPLYIKRLTEIEYSRGNADVSLKYIQKLKSTLFYKTWAKEFEKRIYTESNTSQKIKANDVFLAKEMLYNIEQSWSLGNKNSKIMDFLLARYMLDNQYNAFIQLMKQTHLDLDSCETYQEFLLMYAYLLKDNSLISQWHIGKNVIERFYQYLQINQSGKTNEEIKQLLAPFNNTYWFYVQFNKK